jgi:excinuclease ABC subunit B
VRPAGIQYTIDETNRRRKIQEEFNRKHGIVPQTNISEIKNFMTEHLRASGWEGNKASADDAGLLRAAEPEMVYHSIADLHKEIKQLEARMRKAADNLAFEEAAALRDQIKDLKMLELEVG